MVVMIVAVSMAVVVSQEEEDQRGGVEEGRGPQWFIMSDGEAIEESQSIKREDC
jgi:hypothetical protein